MEGLSDSQSFVLRPPAVPCHHMMVVGVSKTKQVSSQDLAYQEEGSARNRDTLLRVNTLWNMGVG